jgi:hypothetical protein
MTPPITFEVTTPDGAVKVKMTVEFTDTATGKHVEMRFEVLQGEPTIEHREQIEMAAVKQLMELVDKNSSLSGFAIVRPGAVVASSAEMLQWLAERERRIEAKKAQNN